MDRLLTLIEKALNQIPKYDTNFDKNLHLFKKGSFGFTVTDINKTIFLCLQVSTFILTEKKPEHVTSILYGSVYDYYAFIKGYVLGSDEFNFRIEGDQESIYQLRNLFTQIDLDWEEILSEVTGDEVAFELAYRLRQIKKMVGKLTQTHKENLSEFITEEAKLTPSKEELSDFYEDVQQMSYDLDRVEAKLRKVLSGGVLEAN